MTAAPDPYDDGTPEAMNRHRTPDPDCDPAREALLGPGAGDEELRALFHEAVRDLRPAPDALDHLRRAVPARRLHRRQAMAGSVAALLLVGAAVPALVHAAGAAGGATAAPAGPGSTRTPQPDEDGRADAWGTSGDAGTDRPGADEGSSGRQTTASGGDGNSAGAATSPSLPPDAAPPCSAAQLGKGSSNAVPDADGHVRGWFRVANVSTSACTVPAGPATVNVIAHGSADPALIRVVDHTAGDAAPELPPPAGTDQPLVLAPGESYEVAFAWVPADTGPGGCPPPSSPPASPTATPTPTGTDGPTAVAAGTTPAAGSGGAADGGQSAGTPTGTTAPPTIALSHTPAAGAPVVAGPTLQDACAGTVYTTAPVLEDAPASNP